MVILRARLEPLAGAVVMRALEAAGEALHAKKGTEQKVETEPTSMDPEPARPVAANPPALCTGVSAADELGPGQRRADALVLIAESALAAGLDPGTQGDRYQVVVHVDAPVLADSAEQGVSALSDGKRVSAETSRLVACDSATVVMTHAPDGSVLDVGRRAARSTQPWRSRPACATARSSSIPTPARRPGTEGRWSSR
jgi:uncharacterized protein DUF222